MEEEFSLSLSLRERIMLIKALLSNLPSYYVFFFFLCQSRLRRSKENFFYGKGLVRKRNGI